MENFESDLKIKKIYFSKLSFKRGLDVNENYRLTDSLNVEYNKLSDNEIEVKLFYNAKAEDDTVNIEAVENGVFELINTEKYSNDDINYILKVNTIAIMFPFLRSQILLLTSQPGFNPVPVPAVNAEALFKMSGSK